MADKIPLVNEKVIKVEGYFNISETYNDVKNYLENERSYDMTEKDFTEKNDGNHVYVYTINSGDFTYTDYLGITIDFKLELKGEEVEIEIDDKKIILVKGSSSLSISSYGTASWYDKRKLSPFNNFVTKMLEKFHGKDGMKKLKDKANSDVEGLIVVYKRNMRSIL